MENNVGFPDRTVRVTVGIILLAFAVFKPDWSLSWLGWIGIVPVVTGIWGWCPLYKLIGIDSRGIHTNE